MLERVELRYFKCFASVGLPLPLVNLSANRLHYDYLPADRNSPSARRIPEPATTTRMARPSPSHRRRD